MKITQQFVVISYDISSNRKRTKAMKTLEGYGTHVQFSVFECRLKPTQVRQMLKQLKPLVEDGDSIRFYFIGADDVPRIEIIGKGKVMEDKAFFLH